MLSAKKFAARAQVSYTTVMAWLRAGLIPNANFVEESPHGSYWEIPASSIDKVQKPKRGRKAKKSAEDKQNNQ